MILMIDDEPRWIEGYKSELELSGYKVALISKVDDLKQIFLETSRYSDIELVILDIMMAPGDLYSGKKSKQGIITGLLVLEDLRQKFPSVPILILTNKTQRDDEFKLRHLYNEYCLKEEVLATELPDKIKELLKRNSDGC